MHSSFLYVFISLLYMFRAGSWVAQWLRRCATSRTVPGSIPGGVTGDFFPRFPPTKPCALGSTQSLKMSTRDFSWGKGGRCVELTTYHPCSAESQKIRGLNLPGTPLATSACRGTHLLFTLLHVSSNPVLIIRRINRINTSGIRHCVSVTVSSTVPAHERQVCHLPSIYTC